MVQKGFVPIIWIILRDFFCCIHKVARLSSGMYVQFAFRPLSKD